MKPSVCGWRYQTSQSITFLEHLIIPAPASEKSPVYQGLCSRKPLLMEFRWAIVPSLTRSKLHWDLTDFLWMASGRLTELGNEDVHSPSFSWIDSFSHQFFRRTKYYFFLWRTYAHGCMAQYSEKIVSEKPEFPWFRPGQVLFEASTFFPSGRPKAWIMTWYLAVPPTSLPGCKAKSADKCHVYRGRMEPRPLTTRRSRHYGTKNSLKHVLQQISLCYVDEKDSPVAKSP